MEQVDILLLLSTPPLLTDLVLLLHQTAEDVPLGLDHPTQSLLDPLDPDQLPLELLPGVPAQVAPAALPALADAHRGHAGRV